MAAVTRISEALAASWPARFLPMPDRRERVSVIVAHHALRSEIRRRGEASGGAVSGEDLARWVDSVIVYTRAVQTLTALRAIREAGAAYHINPGGTMEQTSSRRAVVPKAIQELRAALTPTLRKQLEQRGNRTLIDLFAVVRRLQPGDVRTMLFCHRALVRAVQRDLAAVGYCDVMWADLPRLVFNLLEEEGYTLTEGRWIARGAPGGTRTDRRHDDVPAAV
jgi:hypothetical protein